MKYVQGMSCVAALVFLTGALAQSPAPESGTPLLGDKAAQDLATRMLQLMESTAVAVPGLIHASEPVRQNAEATLGALRRGKQDIALTWGFVNQVRAYLALSDSIPRPSVFPPAADQQFAELREDLQRMQRHFEAMLEAGSEGMRARAADPSSLKRYADANSKITPPGKQARVVFLGDSITEGWRLNEYFTGSDFVNRGIEGQTTAQMLGRFLQDVVALRPRAVLIFGGTNDIGYGIAQGAIEDNLTMMGDLARAHGIKPLFASVLPAGDYHKDADPEYEMTRTHPPAAIRQLNRWLQEYCRKENFSYVDYYAAMADKTGQMPADLSDDGLHPNAKGYRVMSPVTLGAINRILLGAGPTEEAPARRRFGPVGK
jgi:lysophospholipase L1-like esterase